MKKSQWNNSRSKVHTVVNSAGRVAHVRAMNVVDQHEAVEEVSTMQETGRNWNTWMSGMKDGVVVTDKEWTGWHKTKDDAERAVRAMWEKAGWTVWNVVVK